MTHQGYMAHCFTQRAESKGVCRPLYTSNEGLSSLKIVFYLALYFPVFLIWLRAVDYPSSLNISVSYRIQESS